MSDSDFSDVEDAPATRPSLTSSVTVRIAVISSDGNALPAVARLGGSIYKWTRVAPDTVTVVYRNQPLKKPSAADSRKEQILEIATSEDSAAQDDIVVVDILGDEPKDALELATTHGVIKLLWVLGDKPSHPGMMRRLIKAPEQPPQQPIAQPQPPQQPIAQPQPPQQPIAQPQPQSPQQPIAQPQPPKQPIAQPQSPQQPIAQPQPPQQPIAIGAPLGYTTNPAAAPPPPLMSTVPQAEPAPISLQELQSHTATPQVATAQTVGYSQSQQSAPSHSLNSNAPVAKVPPTADHSIAVSHSTSHDAGRHGHERLPYHRPAEMTTEHSVPSTIVDRTATTASNPYATIPHSAPAPADTAVRPPPPPTMAEVSIVAPVASAGGVAISSSDRNSFIHVEFIKVRGIKAFEPTSYGKATLTVPGIHTSPFTLNTHQVKRNSNPVFHSDLPTPIPIPQDFVEAFTLQMVVQVLEKKLVTADAVLAQGKVVLAGNEIFSRPSRSLDVECELGNQDCVATLRIVISQAPVQPREQINPLCELPLALAEQSDGAAFVQLEILRAELKKEEAPTGVYFSQYTKRSQSGDIVTDRTLAVLCEKSTPLWLYSTQIALKSQAVALDLSVVRSNSLKKTEEVVGVYRNLTIDFPLKKNVHNNGSSNVAPNPFILDYNHMNDAIGNEWVNAALELQLPPGEAVRKEKSDDAGTLFVRYRAVSQRFLEQEAFWKKQKYLEPLMEQLPVGEGQDTESQSKNHERENMSNAAPTLLHKFSLKMSVVEAVSMLVYTPKDKFPDSQLVVSYAAGKESRSNSISVDAAHETFSPKYELEIQMEPSYRIQQFVIKHLIPSQRNKVVGVGYADIDITALQPGVPQLISVTLEARLSEGDGKEYAEDVALLNRAGCQHFGVVTLSVVVQRLDYWSNSSVLNITKLKLLKNKTPVDRPTFQQQQSMAYTPEPSAVAMWFRNHWDFTIPREHVHLVPLDTTSMSMVGALQMPTPFALDHNGNLAPLCIAVLNNNISNYDQQVESLDRTLKSLLQAVEKRVYEVEGLGERSLEEISIHIHRSTQKEIAVHVKNYLELDLTSFLMEAAVHDGQKNRSVAFQGLIPVGNDNLQMQLGGNWSAVSQHLRDATTPAIRVHGFELPSEVLWAAKVRVLHRPEQTPAAAAAAANNSAISRKQSSSVMSSHHSLPPQLSFQFVATEVQVPQPPQFRPRVEDFCAETGIIETYQSDEASLLALFVFAPAHNSRTNLVVLSPPGEPLFSVKMDMLLRSGNIVSSSPEFDITLDWYHGSNGVSAVDERNRRKLLETEWRLSQRESSERDKLLATFLSKSEWEPPRRCGATLCRVQQGNAILVGGMDETSRPMNSMFMFNSKEKKWAEWVPERVLRHHTDDIQLNSSREQQSSFAVNQRVIDRVRSAQSSKRQQLQSNGDGSYDGLPLPVFHGRHGHTSVFSPSDQSVIVYGGIGPNGFDPACVGDDGYVPLKSRATRRGNANRYGYLSEVWVLDLKHTWLRLVKTEQPQVTTTASTTLSEDKTLAMHHDLRWRHSAVYYPKNSSMYVFGGKTVVVKSVSVPYDLRESKSKHGGNPDTTYYIAVETICSCEYISVLATDTMTWRVLHTSGAIPEPRYGHGTTIIGNKVYLFGGRGQAQLFNNLFVLDLDSLRWEEILPFGTVAPPVMDVVGFCASKMSDGNDILVAIGGRRATQSVEDAAKEKLHVYYFTLDTLFWHSLSFNVNPGQRRIMPAICDVTQKRSTVTSLKRLPYEFAPIINILVVGGERNVMGSSNTEEEEVPQVVAAEESEFFDGSSVHPRPCECSSIINIAVDPGDAIFRSAVLHQKSAHITEEVLCPHLRFRDATVPGWALEKAVARLAMRPQIQPQQPPEKNKRQPLTSAEQAKHLSRVDADIENRKKSQEQRLHDAYEEVREQASRNVSGETKKWDDDAWLQHYYRVYYKPALKYARSRNLPFPKLPQKLQELLDVIGDDPTTEGEQEARPSTATKLRGREEMQRANERLYYQPLQHRKEAMQELSDALLRPQRPASARRVTRDDVENAVKRLHRGPPSPLSSQKFGADGKKNYTDTSRR